MGKSEAIEIGRIMSVYDPKTGTWREGEIVRAEANYVCCKGTEGEHTHEAVYDVRFSDRISCGHLPPFKTLEPS